MKASERILNQIKEANEALLNGQGFVRINIGKSDLVEIFDELDHLKKENEDLKAEIAQCGAHRSL